MKLWLYNTLSRQKEEFVPISSPVKMYSCGPTVYSYAHIGNMRAYIFVDALKRVLSHCGYSVFSVLNITDVGHLTDDGDDGEDKLLEAAKQLKRTPYQIAEYYTNAFLQDIASLNIAMPSITAKATDHIDEMLSMCQKLVSDGYGYETEDGVYFDTSKANNYGKLSGNKEGNLAGARVQTSHQKRNPADFAIWKKAAPNHTMQWDSPWGKSYPGWHIECSAMAHKYLGDHFDIHTGGIDHVPVHHENEIAQSEAYTGQKTVNYWMHNEFVQVDGGKMSKSLGNNYTLYDLSKKGYSPMDYKMLCHTTHYRKKLNFSWEAIDAAKVSLSRLRQSIQLHKNSRYRTHQEILDNIMREYNSAISDDLNIPLVLGILHTALKNPHSIDIFDMSIEMDKTLGLQLDMIDDNQIIPQPVLDLAEKRWQSKLSKDYIIADTLRKQIFDEGYEILDNKDSYIIKRLP